MKKMIFILIVVAILAPVVVNAQQYWALNLRKYYPNDYEWRQDHFPEINFYFERIMLNSRTSDVESLIQDLKRELDRHGYTLSDVLIFKEQLEVFEARGHRNEAEKLVQRFNLSYQENPNDPYLLGVYKALCRHATISGLSVRDMIPDIDIKLTKIVYGIIY